MERVGIDVRVQGRAQAAQELAAVSRSADDLGRDLRGIGTDAGRAEQDFDRSMRDMRQASASLQTGVAGDVSGIRGDLRGLGADADQGVAGMREAFRDLDSSPLIERDGFDLVGGIGGWTAIGAAAATAFGAAFNEGLGQELSLDRAAAAIGAFDAASQAELSSTIDALYRDAYGGSYDEVATATVATAQATGGLGLSQQELQDATAAAQTLADTFGASVDEIALGVGNLATTTGEDLFSVFDNVAAAVDGTNGFFREDLFDTLMEYSSQLDDLGLSSEQFLSVLGTASTSGVFNLDVVADSMKELLVRLREGTDPVREALAELGLDVDGVIESINAGGPGAAGALDDVLAALQGVDDVTRGRLSAELGAGPLENLGLGAEGLDILRSFNDGLGDTEGAMQRLQDTAYSNTATEFTSQWRTFTQTVIPPLTEGATHVLSGWNAVFDAFGSEGIDSTSRLGRAIEGVQGFLGGVRDDFGDLRSVMDDGLTAITGWWGDVGASIDDLTNGVLPSFENAFDSIGRFIGGFFDGFFDQLDRAITGLQDLVGLGGTTSRVQAGNIAPPKGTGGGTLAETLAPSIAVPQMADTAFQTATPVQVTYAPQVQAIDADSVRRFFSDHRRTMAEEVARAVGRAGVTG